MRKRLALAMIVVALLLAVAPQSISAFDTPECNAWARNPGSWGLAYECLYSIVGYF